MFRILILQRYDNLSDEQIEYQIKPREGNSMICLRTEHKQVVGS
ncbi:MAG: transposase [Tannerella sp.]|nr:transposase [Tannerella sp.]